MKTRRLPQSVFLWVALSLLPLPLSFAAVDEYNVPREVNVCVKNTSGLAINGDINPFYLSADFDGDRNSILQYRLSAAGREAF